jgi:hypothetical protein
MATVTLWLLVSGGWFDITRLNDDTHIIAEDGITINRGRSDEQGNVPPTSVSGIRYLDRLNTLDGENPNSPYYRLIGQGTPVRVEIDGEVRAEIELASVRTVRVPSSETTSVIEHTIDAAGVRMRLEGSQKPVVSAATRYYARSTPWQWWAMEEGAGVQVLTIPTSIPTRDPNTFEARTYLQSLRASPASAGSGENARVSGAVAGDTTTGPPGSAGAVNVSGGGQLSASFTVPGPSLGLNHLVVEGWFMFSSPVETTGSGQVVRIALTSETTIGFFVQPASVTGPAVFEINSGSEIISESNSQTVPDDGDWHHLLIEFTRVTGITFDYAVSIDGIPYFASTTSATALLDITEFTLSPTGELGAVSQWAIWKDGYEFVDALDAYNAGSGFSGFTPDSLIGHLLDEAGIETAASNPNEVLTETISIVALDSGALMQQIDSAANAGQVTVIDKRDEYDQLNRINRTTLYNQVATATIRHEQLMSPLEAVNDSYDGRIVNSWTMSGGDGESEQYTIPDNDPYHWTTQPPPVGVGVRDRGDTFPVTPSNLRQLAAWFAHVYSWRERRFVNIAVDLAKTDTEFLGSGFTADEIAAILELDVGKVIALDTSDAPAYVPYSEVRMLVQGYTETASKFQHTIVFNTTPSDVWEVEVTEFGPTALLANVMDDNDTTVRIAPGDGPPPSGIEQFHISINGDPMTVTSSSSATPAQVGTPGAAAFADNAAVVPDLPTGMTPDIGQLMLLWATRRGTTATFAAPSGWTQITAQGAGYLFGRYYVTGDTAPTVTPSGGSAGTTIGAQIAAFSGLSMTLDKNTQDALSENGVSGQTNGSAQNIAFPALTARRGSSAMFIFGSKDDDSTGVTPPAGFAEVGDTSSTLGNDITMAWYFDADAGIAPEIASGSLTVGGGASAASSAMSVALRPLHVCTVTRSIAGVATSHTPGQEVHIWRPGAVAL